MAGAAIALVPVQSAHAVVAAAPPGAAGFGYVTEQVVTAPGGVIEFVNLDIDSHNFTAFDAFFSKKEAKAHDWCGSYRGRRV